MRVYQIASVLLLVGFGVACGGLTESETADPSAPGDPAKTAQPSPPAQPPSTSTAPAPSAPTPTVKEHHERFVGLWIVEQPSHALYEATFYEFVKDGTLRTGRSDPAGCTGHLSEHCVTGSVANCEKNQTATCVGTISCVFGKEWYSLDSATLIIVGTCSDGVARDIRIAFAKDASSNTEFGGSGATLVSVDGDTKWSHDNWDWAFRRCPAGTTEVTCR